jgi:hypothetical protein
MKKYVYGFIFLMCLTASIARGGDYTEIKAYVNRERMHESSYSFGYRYDIDWNLKETKRSNHGSSTVDGGISFVFYQGAYLQVQYIGPGGWGYASSPGRVCLPEDRRPECPGYLYYCSITLPTDTDITFLKMGRPYANQPVSLAYPNSSGTAWVGSDPVNTNSRGQATFLPKMGTPIYGGSVSGNIADYNDNILMYGGQNSETVLIEKGRPAPQRWTTAPNGSDVDLTIFWEDISNTPLHEDYLFVIYDLQGNMAGYSFTSQNKAMVTTSPGTSFLFQIYAWDTENRLYADSEVWSVTAPGSRSATLSGNQKSADVLKIAPEASESRIAIDDAKSMKTFARGYIDEDTKVVPTTAKRRINKGFQVKADNPDKYESLKDTLGCDGCEESK